MPRVAARALRRVSDQATESIREEDLPPTCRQLLLDHVVRAGDDKIIADVSWALDPFAPVPQDDSTTTANKAAMTETTKEK